MDTVVYEALRKAIELNPNDQLSRDAFTDFAQEQGIVNSGHDWEDHSYHGSPDYYCENCGLAQWKVRLEGVHPFDLCVPCTKPGSTLSERERERAAEVEYEERQEYAKLKAERERWEYLHQKYGGD